MGALLFYCEDFDKRKSNAETSATNVPVSVTDVQAYWAQGPKKVLNSPKRISDICF